jgi:hypothetical protein
VGGGGGGGDFKHKKCVLICSTKFIRNISGFKNNSASYYHKAHGSSCKVPFILARFQLNLNVLYRLKKKTEILNFGKIRPVVAKLFHADRRTDSQTYDEANSCFSQFCERA